MLDHWELAAYTTAHTTTPSPLLAELTEATRRQTKKAGMQSGPGEAALLIALTRIMQPRFVVEVGTFTGASALAIASTLPEGGRMLCCDISEEWTAIGREYWERAGVADRIDLKIGPAIDTLASLPRERTIDLAFIDADKGGYIAYYNEIVPRLSPNGAVVVDNVIWDGAVLDPSDRSPNTVAIRDFNTHVLQDDRVDVVMLPVGDGVSLITLRPARDPLSGDA